MKSTFVVTEYRGIAIRSKKFEQVVKHRRGDDYDYTISATARHPIYWVGCEFGDAYASNPRAAMADIKSLVDGRAER